MGERDLVKMEEDEQTEAITKIEIGNSVYEFESVNEEEETNELDLKPFKIEGSKLLLCKLCGKQFKHKKSLQDHNSSVHKFKDSPCNICEKTFARRKLLSNHMTACHKEKKCLSCDQTFKYPSYVRH